ncbi:hypothetical protein [Ornithinimicrobium kibberense]|uniref:hypothetical protein n=1 Tax=Ornithinimicrobium kibberense TaxID=282060 RepID=UPI00361AE148
MAAGPGGHGGLAGRREPRRGRTPAPDPHRGARRSRRAPGVGRPGSPRRAGVSGPSRMRDGIPRVPLPREVTGLLQSTL